MGYEVPWTGPTVVPIPAPCRFTVEAVGDVLREIALPPRNDLGVFEWSMVGTDTVTATRGADYLIMDFFLSRFFPTGWVTEGGGVVPTVAMVACPTIMDPPSTIAVGPGVG